LAEPFESQPAVVATQPADGGREINAQLSEAKLRFYLGCLAVVLEGKGFQGHEPVRWRQSLNGVVHCPKAEAAAAELRLEQQFVEQEQVLRRRIAADGELAGDLSFELVLSVVQAAVQFFLVLSGVYGERLV